MARNPRRVKAVVNRRGALSVEDVELPPTGPEQLRVRPLAVGVCGTDLSAWSHSDEFLAELESVGATNFQFDADKPVVFGHEFTAEVLEVGCDVTTQYAVGDLIYAMPLVFDGDAMRTVGFSNRFPGALSEEVVVEGRLHIRLDDGVDPILAAMLDPICTGIEGARRTGAVTGDVTLVTGVGPVGLGAVAELAERGCRVVASDPSEARRSIALQMGASVAVDPATEDPVARAVRDLPEGGRLRVVEASGAPGVLGGLVRTTPRFSVIVVVGASTAPEPISTLAAATSNKTVIFASGPDHGELRYEALHRGYDLVRSGRVDLTPMASGCTGLAGAPALFDALRPGQGSTELVKPLVVPALDTDRLMSWAEFQAR
jgi:threonine dehydrogenase-like Zn-dependent dehydrogenase